MRLDCALRQHTLSARSIDLLKTMERISLSGSAEPAKSLRLDPFSGGSRVVGLPGFNGCPLEPSCSCLAARDGSGYDRSAFGGDVLSR